jgi:hypothetical protein
MGTVIIKAPNKAGQTDYIKRASKSFQNMNMF